VLRAGKERVQLGQSRRPCGFQLSHGANPAGIQRKFGVNGGNVFFEHGKSAGKLRGGGAALNAKCSVFAARSAVAGL
jgi:hypothetical protein